LAEKPTCQVEKPANLGTDALGPSNGPPGASGPGPAAAGGCRSNRPRPPIALQEGEQKIVTLCHGAREACDRNYY